MSKRQAASFPSLVLTLFARIFPGESWAAWRVLLKAVLGRPLSGNERPVFEACTHRATPPASAARELWTIVGRRSGKSRLAAFLAVCLAVLRTYRLAPGEKPLIVVIAPAKYQTDIIMNYVRALLDLVPGVTIVRETDEDGIELSAGDGDNVTIRPAVASFKTVRGFTIVGAVVDEAAFFEGQNTDTEILRAIRPSLAGVPGSLLVAISSPYAQRGELHKAHERHFGKDSDVLVWQADTRTMNPTFSQAAVDRAMEDDPEGAQAEYGGRFRSDLEQLWSREALRRVVVPGRTELPPSDVLPCVAFIDTAGGAGGGDSFTLAIAFRDPAGQAVLAVLRERRPPFSPEDVCREFAAEIKRYACRAVFSDAYAGQWPVEQFAKHGVTVVQSRRPPKAGGEFEMSFSKSEIYLELVPMVNSGACELLDNTRLLDQLAGLDRRTGRSGRDSVDHRPGAHDDLANAAAGALVMCVQQELFGMRTLFPPAFTECVNDAAFHRCALIGTGPWLPGDAHCYQHCVGHQVARPAWTTYNRRVQEGKESETEPLSCLKFIRSRFETPRFISDIRWRVFEEAGWYH